MVSFGLIKVVATVMPVLTYKVFTEMVAMLLQLPGWEPFNWIDSYSLTTSMIVISGGAKRRIGGPHVPVPRET